MAAAPIYLDDSGNPTAAPVAPAQPPVQPAPASPVYLDDNGNPTGSTPPQTSPSPNLVPPSGPIGVGATPKPTGTLDKIGDALDTIENYTQEGREDHPVLARLGDAVRDTKELLTGGQSAGKPLGTSSGILNNPVTTAVSLAPAAAEAAPALAEKAGRLIPSAERAGQTMRALRDAVGEHPVTITDDLSGALSRAQELADNGNTMPTAVRKLINRVTDPEKGHLTYNEARDFSTKLGGLTADEQTKLAPVMKQQLTKINLALRDSIANTAANAGKLEDFIQSNNEYRNAKTVQKVIDWAKDVSATGLAQKAGATGLLYELKKLIGQ